MQLNFDYDERSDVLYASFGPPRPAIGDALDGDDSVILRYEESSGRMVGFTLVGLARRGTAGLRVPLIGGDVRREDQGIRQDTPWLELRMMSEAVVEISLRGGARKLRVPVSTVGGGASTQVALDALFAAAAH